ncbi:DUF1697 domain-containing protein [Candidatus Fermentibacteria bacterium]|nr:DUF1697 domain-containing protein [Candidatus Fermentibacteria bacterium]
MTRCIALLRGINVGRSAKRVAMADLRALLEGLGFSNVRMVLNSGNAVFHASRPDAAGIEEAFRSRFGFAVPVVVLTVHELDAVIAQNPLPQAEADPSKFLVAFTASAATLEKAKALLAEDWAPEAFSVGHSAAYLWCAHGIIESRLAKAFARVTADATTTRNWATVRKLQVAAGAHPNAA